MRSRRAARIAAACAIVAASLAVVARPAVDRWIALTPLPPLHVTRSTEVVAADGRLLRAFTVEDGRWRLDVDLDAVDATYLRMLLAYEDRRFYQHGGVDARAIVRAAWQAATSGRVVSGASTLSMQVARLLDGGTTGSWRGKVRQIRVAWALEARWSKDEILRAYLHLAPMGGNVEGIRAGSFVWLGHEPTRLTEAEAALLVALPQAPSTRAPDVDPAAALEARDRVLRRAFAAGVIDEDTLDAALREPLPTQRRAFPSLAPHLADRLQAGDPSTARFVTSIDAEAQAALQQLAGEALTQLPPAVTVAMMVARVDDGRVIATVGSAAYADAERRGFVDVTQALRSPGSTLKPLVYALAFSDGIVHPETLLDDRPTSFGGYAPQNFDGVFRGPVTAREALVASLNLPVVAITEVLGPARVIAALRQAGVTAVVPGDAPGLAIALGGVGVTLEGLVQAYLVLARGGAPVPLSYVAAEAREEGEATAARLVTPQAAWLTSDVLTGTARPAASLAGSSLAGVALKTGTSFGNRDAWALAFDDEVVVGVWVGRADGTAVPGLTGVTAAAPLAFQAFERLGGGASRLPAPPPGTRIVSGTDALPPSLRRFGVRGELPQDAPRLAFPPPGAAVVALDGRVLARVEQGQPPFTWFVDDVPVVRGGEDRSVNLPVEAPGFAAVSVVDAAGRAARVAFEVR